ncbi:leucine-rich melanocyte differentiation-associated protein-like isoform X2 [Arctopsyche grandis]
MLRSKLVCKSGESFQDDESIYNIIDIDLDSSETECNMISLTSLIHNERRNADPNQSFLSTADQDETRLTLAYERLRVVPKSIVDQFADSVQILDISHNNISNLDFLVHFKCLNTLIADSNQINETTTLPQMPNLRLLWFNHCKVTKLYPWIKSLHESCPNLTHLSLMGNYAAPSYFNGGTFYEYLQYRLYVISLFDSLVHLDDRAVTKDQKREAVRLYRRPFLERLAVCTSKDFPFSVALK